MENDDTKIKTKPCVNQLHISSTAQTNHVLEAAGIVENSIILVFGLRANLTKSKLLATGNI